MAKLSFDLNAALAAFAAKGGEVKKLETVDVANDKEAQKRQRDIARRASGREAEIVRNYVFEAFLEGEDGGEFCINFKAKSESAAFGYVEEQYPESRLIRLDFQGAREERLYREAWDY